MKFDHMVKVGDVWYKAGTEVPAFTEEKPTKTEVENKPIAETSEPKNETYTKAQIYKLTSTELKDLAEKNGVDSGLKRQDLIKAIIEALGL